MGPTGADLIVQARRTAGLTQRELATRAGTTQSSVARWESGRSEPAFGTVVRLLRRYDDGLRDDWHQAQQLLQLTPEQIVDQDRRLHAWFAEGQKALAEALAARDAS
jgi:transcriptional regulator with XRE-family HTH domain